MSDASPWLTTPHTVDLSHHEAIAEFLGLAQGVHIRGEPIDHVRRVWVENGWREIFAPGLAGEMMG